MRTISGARRAVFIWAAACSLISLSALADPALPSTKDVVARAERKFDPETSPGKAVFADHCAACHDGGVDKAPHQQFLEMMEPAAIMRALTDGVMRDQGSALSMEQKRQVAEYLTKTTLDKVKPAPGARACTGKTAAFDTTRPPSQTGWGYDPRRYAPASAALLAPADVPRLKVKWAFAFPRALRARSQPLVAMNSIFVGSQDGTVYAFDLDSGCARWTSKVTSEVRTGIVMEPWTAGQTPPRPPRLFFGDLLGRVYAMDAFSGRIIWKTRPDDHPNATITGTPLLHGDTLYVPVSSLENVAAVNPNYACCTFRGSVVALDVATGAVKWRHYTVTQPATEHFKNAAGAPVLGPSGASVWTSPTYDPRRHVIYHGSGQNYSTPADGNSDAVFAVDAATGKRRWVNQVTPHDSWNPACAMPNGVNCPREKNLDHDIAASVLLIDLEGGGQILVAGQKSGMVYGIDPNSGKTVWERRLGRGSLLGGIHFGMAAEGSRVYAGVVDVAIGGDGKPQQSPGSPGLYAVDAATGKLLWSDPAQDQCKGRPFCAPGVSAALTAIPGIVFAGHLDGMLRAYDSATGKMVWQSDTTVPVRAVNGPMTVGGSISGPGATVEAGHVIINSGYGYAMHAPGNALLVYTVDGK